MASQASQLDCNVSIYFVVSNKYAHAEDCTDELWNAYNKCCSYELEPHWITEDKCYTVTSEYDIIFVMEEFAGDVFEKLRSSKTCKILGPQCLLICLDNGETIPDGNAVFTTAMRDICVCVSGLSKNEKEQIQRLVEFMGGVFVKQLRTSVTHLITDSVLSAKYESAIGMKIPVFTKEWVEAIWKANLKEYVQANNKCFDKYRCPIFMNLVVTSTNLNRHQKEELKILINNNGGIYMGPLDGTRVKIVLTPENSPLSDKLKYAMQNNIACLNPNWVYESISAGYVLPFHNFLIKSTKACSTPEKSYANASFNVSTISNIHCDMQRNHIDESTATIANLSTMDWLPTPGSRCAEIPIFSRLMSGIAYTAGAYLDGCTIYLAGFTQHEKDKLNKILSLGAATRVDDISDAVTHVLIGDEGKASRELNLITSRELCPYLLTLEWLEESMKLKAPATEEHFLYKLKNTASRKTGNNEQMVELSKKSSMSAKDTNKKTPLRKNDNIPMQHYLEEAAATSETVQEFLKPHEPTPGTTYQKNNMSGKNQDTANISSSTVGTRQNSTGNESLVPLSQVSIIGERIFQDLTFAVSGFANDDNYVAESISALGGKLVSQSYTGIVDYGVVPVFGSPVKQVVNQIVTNLFIEDCINAEKIVDIKYYHRPAPIENHSKPLSACVITVSMYSGGERVFLSTLAVELGAVFQDTFARKTNVAKNTLASTHLVCPTPEGNKYNAAVKWKLPAVTADWLRACASQLKLVDETSYLVGKTTAPDRSHTNDDNESSDKYNQENVPCSNTLVAKNMVTPKRIQSQLQDRTSSAGSILINKRLSLVMSKTPPSPFHVATPETPYGQVFKPDPSPETRKGWKKWVDSFPDLYISEPPVRRRAPSTPLSELKRQLWKKLKNAGNDEDEAGGSNRELLEERKELTPPSLDGKKSLQSDDTLLVSKKLEFHEKSPPHNREINNQIAQLEEAFERIPSTSETRYSVASKSELAYNKESVPLESQPDTVGWENPNLSLPKPMRDKSPVPLQHNEPETNNPTLLSNLDDLDFDTMSKFGSKIEATRTRKFMLSGMKDRTVYEQVIQELGGEISMDSNFDRSATHLLCTRPARNEKMLGSIAAGKWVLHCSYLRDSEQEGHFLNEEEYEWGNPKSKGIIPDPAGNTEAAIAAAAYKWRLKLSQEPYGPFYGMVALLMVVGDKYDQFKRLIEAGGGAVVRAKPPYDIIPSGEKITHCFVNVKQISQPIDWSVLANKGILCFLPQYLSDQLTTDAQPKPEDCVLPEFKQYLSLLPK